MHSRLRETVFRIWTSFWFVPALIVAVSIALSYGAELVDERLSVHGSAWYLFKGGPDGARAVLSAVASSMMTVSSVVFSVTILVLQLASAQFSPRVLRTFLRDRATQAALGVFVGTFVYALLTLRNVREDRAGFDSFVPALSVWMAVLLAVACVGLFIYYVHHVAQSVRAVNALGRIGDEARAQLERLYPEELGGEPETSERSGPVGAPASVLMLEGRSGVLKSVDEEALLACACAAGGVVKLIPMMGDFVPHGAPLFEFWGSPDRLDEAAVCRTVTLGLERSMRQDLAFAFRQLVDVAERALSAGVNDPTTAVQALDQVHDLLRRLIRREFPSPFRTDPRDGQSLRLILPRPDWGDYVTLGIDEIRRAGKGSLQIVRRLRYLLEDLLSVAPTDRRPVLLRELAMLDYSLEDAFEERDDRSAARESGAQGHGARNPAH